MSIRVSIFSAALVVPVSSLCAQTLPAPNSTAQGDVSVTIYQSGDSLVQDIRQLDIAAGRSTVVFPDVSAEIQPETLSFSAAGTGIVEQNFDFDLLTPTKLMEKAIGQTVTLVRTNPATGQEVRERAKVLSTSGGVVIQVGDRIEVLRDDGLPVRVIFDGVPPNLRARPTLSVTLESERSGTRAASIRYLTDGLDWSTDYVALYDEGKGTIDMQGWITLENRSGTTYHAANTLLVADNPNAGRRGYNGGRSGSFTPGTETADREQVGDYYLYPIAERTTIANNQTKQVSFLDVQGVAARKVYGRTVGWLSSDSQPVNVSSQIAFSSSRDGGLGDALPAGTVRFYQRDRQGNPQFIGENEIGHTPMGSELALATGDAFDVFVQAEVESRDRITSSDYERSASYRVSIDGEVPRTIEIDSKVDYWRTTMRYAFTNAKSVPVDVELVQGGLDYGWRSHDFRVVSEDVQGVQINADRRKFVVTVPANGTREVRVTYETRY